MSTELKMRRDSYANINATTPADGEPGYDQTNKRLIVGDGVRAGGIPHASFKDVQNSAFTAATSAGTNTVTMTLPEAPAAYAARQRFSFIAGGTNTGAATLNVNALGAVGIRKNVGGTLTTLAAGDLTSGRPYEVMHDGTYFVLLGSAAVGAGSITQTELASSAVGQAQLKTNYGVVSRTTIGEDHYVLPGGAYGFYPMTMTQRAGGADSPRAMYWLGGNYLTGNSGYTPDYVTSLLPIADWDAWVTYISMTLYTRSYADTYMNAFQRYITASAPYNMGDGDVPLFVFAKVDTNGDVESIYIAEAPPWAYNGPTSIMPDLVIDGQGFQDVTVFDPRILQGDEAAIVAAYIAESKNKSKRAWNPNMPDPVKVRIPLDHRIKNADMDIIPHPFANETGKTIVLIDPLSPLVERIKTLHDTGENAVDIVNAWLNIDNTPLNRKGPAGVLQVSAAFKKKRKAFE